MQSIIFQVRHYVERRKYGTVLSEKWFVCWNLLRPTRSMSTQLIGNEYEKDGKIYFQFIVSTLIRFSFWFQTENVRNIIALSF